MLKGVTDNLLNLTNPIDDGYDGIIIGQGEEPEIIQALVPQINDPQNVYGDGEAEPIDDPILSDAVDARKAFRIENTFQDLIPTDIALINKDARTDTLKALEAFDAERNALDIDDGITGEFVGDEQ